MDLNNPVFTDNKVYLENNFRQEDKFFQLSQVLDRYFVIMKPT